MKPKRVSEFLMEGEVSAILRVPDRRTLQGKRDYALFPYVLYRVKKGGGMQS